MDTRIGFGRRLGAYLIDVLIIMGLAFILSNLFASFLDNFVDYSKISDQQLAQMQSVYGNFTDIMLTISVSIIFISFIYNLLEGITGYTLGKLLLKIQIGNQDGTKASQGKLMTRFAIKNISSIIGLIGLATMISSVSTVGQILGFIILIGCFFVLGESKLALHDVIARTAVYPQNVLNATEE